MKLSSKNELNFFIRSKGLSFKDKKECNELEYIALCKDKFSDLDFISIFEYYVIHNPVMITYNALKDANIIRVIPCSLYIKAIKNAIDLDKEDVMIEVIRNRNFKKFSAMLELGIDINAKNGMIFTQLCKYGTEDMIKFAVEMYDADPSLNDNNPILFVSKYQNLSTFKFIFKHGGIMGCRKRIICKFLLENAESEDDKKWIRSLCL